MVRLKSFFLVPLDRCLFLASGQLGYVKPFQRPSDGPIPRPPEPFEKGCWVFEVEEGKAVAAKRLIPYPALCRDELDGASGDEWEELRSAAVCYLAETKKIFVLGGKNPNGQRNKYVCEIDLEGISI